MAGGSTAATCLREPLAARLLRVPPGVPFLHQVARCAGGHGPMERLPRPQGSLSSGGVAGPEWRGLAPTSFMHSKALWGQGWPGPRGGRGSTCSSPSVRSPSVMDKSPPACARSSSRCSVPADRSCVPHRLRLPTCLTGAGGEGTPESSCSPCCWPSPWSPHRIPHPSPRHTRCPGGLNRPLPRCPGPHLRPAQRLAWPGLAPGAGGGGCT